MKESSIEEKEIYNINLDWKHEVVLKIEECSEKYGMSVKETFKTLDEDGNATITINELSDFFQKSGIDIAQKDLIEFFDFLDRRKDGKI